MSASARPPDRMATWLEENAGDRFPSPRVQKLLRLRHQRSTAARSPFSVSRSSRRGARAGSPAAAATSRARNRGRARSATRLVQHQVSRLEVPLGVDKHLAASRYSARARSSRRRSAASPRPERAPSVASRSRALAEGHRPASNSRGCDGIVQPFEVEDGGVAVQSALGQDTRRRAGSLPATCR